MRRMMRLFSLGQMQASLTVCTAGTEVGSMVYSGPERIQFRRRWAGSLCTPLATLFDDESLAHVEMSLNR